ncbi:Rhamnogalacturonate lyase [Sesbania bispinosa]|nr:Rhamnogalacturonate lyase [Sesbania bispinosa]
MAISDTRQRNMPAMSDREKGQPLAYPEAVHLTHPSNPQFRGEVDDKYQYSIENTDNNMFVSTHYAGKEVTMSFQEGETYKKVFGPVFVYLNSASSDVHFQSLWSDAVQQLSKEIKSWPYDFPKSKYFFPFNQRGIVAGHLQVQERGESSKYAKNAYVGLALPGDAGSWQKESKGYQFWTRTDGNGYFVIKMLYLGNTTYRSAAEFYVPDPYPTLMNKLYNNDNKNKFRQYGLWERYADMYPNHDLIYTVGVDNYKKDWFFAHVTRSTGHNTFQPTTWKIIFKLQNSILRGNYTLQLALASASKSELQVWFNGQSANRPQFTTGVIGGDSVIARHGIHGLHRLYSIDVGSDHLVKGMNTIYLRQSRAQDPFQGVMYDYISLESPPTPIT